MLVIRLLRIGKKNQPSFKIVVTKKTNPPRGGRSVEEVGFWNPLTKERILKKDRINYWLGVGAKPSPSIYNILISEKIIQDKKIPKHKKSKKEEKPKEGEAAPAVNKAPEPAAKEEKKEPKEAEKKTEEKKEEVKK